MRTIEQEQADFDRLLAGFLEDHTGQTVLFKDGAAVDFFPSYEKAYVAGINRFGPSEIFLVSAIEPPAPRSVSLSWDAGVMFG
jgi:hypothetical protein